MSLEIPCEGWCARGISLAEDEGCILHIAPSSKSW